MKISKKYCIFTLFWVALTVLTTLKVVAQGSPQGYLYVYPSASDAYPNTQGIPSNQGLQSLFQQYQVTAYTQSFPGATSGNLGNAYEIHLDGDENALMQQLASSGLFSLVERESYMQVADTNPLDCPDPCNDPQTVNDPRSDYELTMPGYLCAWNTTQGDPSVVVAVVDTDFDLNHPDLQGQIISKTGAPGSPNCAYHGTAVAGCIVAKANNGLNVAGVAPGARVAGYVVPTFGNCGSCTSGQVWSSVWKAYLDGRRIINVSWTGVGTPTGNITVVQAIQEMTDNGVLLVVAAGNTYGQNYHSAYSNIPGVINVGSVSSDGTIHNTNADPNQPATTYNQWVDLCAPGDGVGIIEIDCGGTLYNNAWGTSQAAPNVAGAAALILSVNPCLKPSEIENILKTTTCPLVNNPIPGETGTGYLNAYAALQKAVGPPELILSDQTWDGEVYISHDVTIVQGVTVTINGKVKVSEGKRIILRPGSHLILNGKLTNSCSNPWEGIVVNGVPGASQYTPGQHGKLTCHPKAVIENANTAVSLVAGGILNASGTFFINNGTGVRYHPYSNFWPFGIQYGQPRDHLGGIYDCSFVANDNYPKAAKFHTCIEMEEVRGIAIMGCSFSNARTIKNPMGNDDYGYGIKATDARFRVISRPVDNTFPPTSYDHTGFKGLGYGIYVGTAQSGVNQTPITTDDFVNVPYTVQQATFSECIYGIHNRFVSQGTIVGNTFNMGKLPPAGSLSGNTPYTNLQVGVFIENGANGFELQENQFVEVDGNVDHTYGTYSQNLGWFNNDVRRNTYTNVEAGNLADENNAIIVPNRGLYYLCNTNTTQKYDFYVYQGGDVRFDQGEQITNSTSFKAAGNTFTKANTPTGDFENNGPQVRYYHDGNAEKPLYHLGLAFSDVDPNTCESSYCLPPCRDRSEWEALKLDYGTTRYMYLGAVSDMQLAQSTSNATLAEQKSNLASGYRMRMDEVSNTLSLHMAFDTAAYNVDSVRVWWQKMDSPVSDMVVARDYLAKGQNTLAFAILDAVPVKFGLSDGELADLNDYRAIMQIMQGESASGLTESKVQQLFPYANNGKGISAAWAKNILTVKGHHFPPVPKPLKSGDRGQEAKQKIETPDFYLVSPNPAKDQVRFARNDVQSVGGTSVIVTDATGRTIWRSPSDIDGSSIIWQTGDTRSGIYFYTIQDTNGLVQSGRISVIK
jgi:subtilisin family serine protease